MWSTSGLVNDSLPSAANISPALSGSREQPSDIFEGIILLGTTAYRAFSDSRAAETEPAPYSEFVPMEGATKRLNMLNDALVLAMYSVAREQSPLSTERRRAITSITSHIGLRDVDSGALIAILQFEPDPSLVTAMTRNLGERITVYLASIVAANPESAAERRYLEALETELEIPVATVAAVQRRAIRLRKQLNESSFFGFPIDHYEVNPVPYEQAS